MRLPQTGEMIMSSKHTITAFYDPDGAETEVRIRFILHPEFAGRMYVDPQPPEPASVEFDSVQMFVLGQWVDAPKLAEWAEEYLQNDGLADAFETAHDDRIAGEEYAAEARAEVRADAREYERTRPRDAGYDY